MAVLLHLETGARILLHARHRLGRSRSSHTRVEAAEVSGDHALIGFSEGWTVRDLGSRNGTFIGGERLGPGVARPLSVGDRVGLGTPEARWEVASLSPPAAAAARSGAVFVEGDADLLALPSLDDPRAVFQHDPGRGWVQDGVPVQDGQIVDVDGARWTLWFPERLDPTREVPDAAPTLDGTHLRFAVSRDEEFVELTVEVDGVAHALPSRTRHYLLLTLARAFARDRENGLSADAAGWLHTEDVQRMLKATRNQIYVSAHRLKKDLAALGLVDADAIVQRRIASRQMRIGTAAFEVNQL